MKAVIICNGRIENYLFYNKYIKDADFIICADGGASHAKKLGLKPDVLLGDFDSLKRDDFAYFNKMDIEILKFPVNKDMTDTELAVMHAADKGCDSIVLIGALGSRADHSLANVMLLKRMLDKGIKGIIVDENNEIMLINDKIVLEGDSYTNVSLIPVTERVEGVTTSGLFYPLQNATIEMGSTWGISNRFVCDRAEVSITSGLMLVVKSRD
ncbi:MAG TPA: thiamine diphosphokinase [Clostridiaceae bacterium]|nr:thiamine diphosphokinase [Clostridiaceae bacterium]